MLWLKQSTAVTFQLGPFVDVTDGVTPETGLATNMDNATTGIRVSKNGAASADRNSGTAPSHDDDGYYRVELSITDTNALGTLHVQYEELGVTLPAWKDFMVLPQNVYDSFFGSDRIEVDTVQFSGNNLPVPATAGVPDVNTVEILDTAVSLTGGNLDVNVFGMAADVITAAAIAVNALDADAFTAAAKRQLGKFLFAGTTSAAGTIVTLIDASLTEADDLWNGASVLFTSGVNQNQSRIIMDFDAGTDTLTFAPPVTAAVGGSDTYEIYAKAGVDVQSWNGTENILQQVQSGSLGIPDINQISILGNASIAEVGGRPDVNVKFWDGIDVPAPNISGVPLVDLVRVVGGLVPTPNTAGIPDVNLAEWLDVAPLALSSQRVQVLVGAMAANVITAAAINAATITAAKFGAGAVDAAALATDAINKIADALLPEANVALSDIPFLFVAASDHVTPVTGASGTAVTRSIDSAAFGAGTGTIAEVGNGIYQYDASAADMNGGKITFRFTGTGGTPGAPDDTFISIITRTGT
jgi:hypothetical protein